MNDYRTTWESYVASWKAPSVAEKRALYEKALNPECVYTDSLTQKRGWDELLTYMREFNEQVPGGYFVTVEFTAHHGRSLARWEMHGADGTVLGDGTSYGEYDSHGKLVSMNGFFKTP